MNFHGQPEAFYLRPLTYPLFSCLSDPLKDRTQPHNSENPAIRLLMEVVKALEGDISRKAFLELAFPELLEVSR